jgi:predicted nucleic acid-binding protein
VHRGERLVVDASVATKWYLTDEDDVLIARRLLSRVAAGELILHAPDVIWLEVGSAITSATLGRDPRLSVEVGERRIARSLSVRMEVFRSRDLLLPAYHLVHEHGCVLYDALYLALALHLGIPLITADRRLYRRIERWPNLIWLGDYSSPR